jgi:hypothetical protein
MAGSTSILVATVSPASEATTSTSGIALRAASKVVLLEPVTITVAPSAWKRLAVAAPIPAVPPVISAILFSSVFRA